jgi:hypothetical protein
MDNNCQIQRVLRSRDDDYFSACALPVDVFHFKCKHKESDDFCAQHCNPAQWPELMIRDEWRFNSSAAEQTNAWYGNFISIVREMAPFRYNFFLDEMVRRRNLFTANELSKRGFQPYLIPRDALLTGSTP